MTKDQEIPKITSQAGQVNLLEAPVNTTSALMINLAAFSGPLDLLLHLIKTYKIDIFDIPIVLITEQYLNYIAQADDAFLGEHSDYLVMAASLIEMKTSWLLPKPEIEHTSGEDIRQPLVNRLLIYQQFQEVSQVLAKKHENRLQQYSKAASDLSAMCEYIPLNEDDNTINDIIHALKHMLNRLRQQEPLQLAVASDPFSIEDAITSLRQFAGEQSGHFAFSNLLGEMVLNRDRLVMLFFALLQLVKDGEIIFQQVDECDIQLQYRGAR